jgi:hypothetical protein
MKTWTMVKADRTRRAEKLKQPRLFLRFRALYLYPYQRGPGTAVVRVSGLLE